MATPDASEPVIVARLRAAGCVFAEDEARLLLTAARTPTALEDMLARRVGGVPLESILGWAEFCGRPVVVEPTVFVPRRRTEFLAHQAIALTRRADGGGRPIVVDLCCGSGAIAVALIDGAGPLELHASDVEPAAVRCARRNVGAAGEVYEGDLYDPLPARLRGRIEVLVANVPYVPTDAIDLMPPEAREYEPRRALDGGADGLDLARRLFAAAPAWLARGGHVLIETSRAQAATAIELVARAGLTPRTEYSEDWDATVVIGTAS